MKFLDPTGRTSYGIAICGRCRKKMFADELSEDRNNPALKVCRDCMDEFDPYRLTQRETENITLISTKDEEIE